MKFILLYIFSFCIIFGCKNHQNEMMDWGASIKTGTDIDSQEFVILRIRILL